MPIYEFYCSKNHRIYQFYARNRADGEGIPRCPEHLESRLEKRVSKFAILSGAEAVDEGDLFKGLEDHQVLEVMEDLQSSYETLGEQPDPLALGNIMKKISGLLGDRTSPELKELIKRLEAGHDPVELEQLFEDVEKERDLFTALRQQFGAKVPPSRDPKLYEMRHYL